MVFNEDAIRDIIYYETERGGQVFFIHNRVNVCRNERADTRLCPDISIAYAHGQWKVMNSKTRSSISWIKI